VNQPPLQLKRYAASSALERPIVLTMKVKEIIKLLEQDGWYLARTKGSHRQFKHPEKAGVVTCGWQRKP